MDLSEDREMRIQEKYHKFEGRSIQSSPENIEADLLKALYLQ